MGGFLQKIMSVSSFDRSMDSLTHDFGYGVFKQEKQNQADFKLPEIYI